MAVSLRLYDVCALPTRFRTLKVLPEFMVLGWEHPGQRKKTVFFGELLSHRHEAEPQQILPSDDVDSRVMVDLLEEVHFKEYFR